MKKLILIAMLVLPLIAGAQTKVKETEVPKSVLITLAKTYDTYKVKTWYAAPGQYIADFVVDGQHGRGYFTAGGDWQYSSFPVKAKECPTLLTTYIAENYPGYKISDVNYIEERSGDNYYKVIISREAIDATDCEMIFDTRGKLMRSNAPEPEAVKREYYTLNNPEYDDGRNTRIKGKRPLPEEDKPAEAGPVEPTGAIAEHFQKNHAKRVKKGPEWAMRTGGVQMVAYYMNAQRVEMEVVYNTETGACEWVGKTLARERYKKGIVKYLEEKFKGEKYNIEKMVTYTADSKYRGADGKKPKPYTYVVVSQKVNREMKYVRLEFDAKDSFTGLLAAPLDIYDIQ